MDGAIQNSNAQYIIPVLPIHQGSAMHTGYTQANGLKIYYGSYGSGTPLILLHAATQTADDWRPFIPRLSERFRVFALDSRGHGRTDNPAGFLSYGQMADDIA